MTIKRTLTVMGLSAVLAISAVSAAFAQPGDTTLNQRGRGGHMGGMRSPGAFIGIRIERVDGGVKVLEVVVGSPAETAGLLVDDVITAIAGQAIGSGDIREALRDYAIGDALELTVTRGTETLTLSVTLGERLGGLRDGLKARGQARLGAVLEDGTLTVTEVLADSPAATAGMLVGDTISAINGTTVTTREEVMVALMAAHVAAADAEGEEFSVSVTVTRDGASVDLTATLPTRPMRPNGMPGMGMGRGMRGMFVQPREDGTGFDMVIPFTLAEGTTLTADAQAAITGLGWTVQPKDGEDGVYELIIPAESVRDGLNLDAMEGMEGMGGMMFAFEMPESGDAMHFNFNLPDGSVIPATPAEAGSNL